MFLGIIIAAAAIMILYGLVYASYSIRSGVYVKARCCKKTNEKVVSLTFDDGPDPEYTPLVLDILKRENIHAVFFLIGRKAEKYPELVQRIVKDGHSIGNHSYSHTAGFPLSSRRKMTEDMRRSHDILENITGETPLMFRPPYGVTNPTVASAVKQMDYETVGWSIRSLDTKKDPREKIVRRIARKLHAGAVLLLHDDRPQSDRLLEMIVELLRREGYRTERADNMLGIKKVN